MQHDMESEFAPPSPSPQTRPTRPTSAPGIPPLSRNPRSQTQSQESGDEEDPPPVQSTTAQRPPRRPTGRTGSTANQHRTQSQYRPPQEPTPPGGRATNMGNGAVKWEFGGQTVYVRDATKHPPGASYAVAVIVGIACIGAIGLQMFTTFVAFTAIVFHGKTYLLLPLVGQDASRNSTYVAGAVMAIGFQAPLIFFAFKVDKRFAAERHRILSISAKIGAIWEGFKQVVAANMLLSLWAFIAVVADTIGDVTFVSMLTDSWVFLFFYATSLYGLSTVGLSESLQLLWDGMVTSEWLRHVKAANDAAMFQLANMKRKQGVQYE